MNTLGKFRKTAFTNGFEMQSDSVPVETGHFNTKE